MTVRDIGGAVDPSAPVGWVRGAVAELFGMVLPVECAGCGIAGVGLCAACAASFLLPAGPVPLAAGGPSGAVLGWAVAPYAREVRRVVVSWKDRGRHDLTGPLSVALARAVGAALGARSADSLLVRPAGRGGTISGGTPGPAPVLLVPAPSGRRARHERGADVVRRLAVRAAARVRAEGVPVRVVPALRWGRQVADQAGLDRARRVGNVAGAMRLRVGAASLVRGRRCLVVDDVITTGATAAEALRVLAAAGGVPVGVAVACATPLHRGLPKAAHLH